MPINSVMLAAVKALMHPPGELKDTYKLERRLVDLTHPHILKPFFRIVDEHVTLKNHNIPVRIFFPNKEGICPLLIFFHGGGFVTGNIDSYSKVCANMATLTKHIVISVDYRLAPEHPFPAALEDCYAVVSKILLDPLLSKAFGQDITLIGDSAGASLAAAVSLMARDKGDFNIKKQILIYPLTQPDHSESSPFKSVIENGKDYLLTAKRINDYVDLYIKDKKDLYNPYFAPLLANNLQNQPNTLIITSEFDALRDEGEAYGNKLLEAGNNVEIHRIPNTIHGFFSLSPLFPEVKDCYTIINDFLNRR